MSYTCFPVFLLSILVRFLFDAWSSSLFFLVFETELRSSFGVSRVHSGLVGSRIGDTEGECPACRGGDGERESLEADIDRRTGHRPRR